MRESKAEIKEQARLAVWNAKLEAQRKANSGLTDREIEAATLETKRNARLAKINNEIGDIVELLLAGNDFAQSLGNSLKEGQGVFGRGIQLASEIAAKAQLNKKRVSKEVREMASKFSDRIQIANDF